MHGDLRSAIRAVMAARTVSAVAILSLALGIGANASVFTLLNSLLIRKMPVVEPDRLVTVSSEFAVSRGFLAGAGWNYAMWEKLQARPELFDGSLAWFSRPVALGQSAQSDVVNGVFVSGGFFTTLGVPARYGRVLSPADDVRGGGSNGPVVVVSHAFWQRRLASDTHIVGKSLIVEGVSFTIVGVAPREFLGLEIGQSFDVALPLASEPLIRGADSALVQPNSYLLLVMLRLKRSQSLQSATALARSVESDIVPATAPQFVRPFALSPAAEGTSSPNSGAGGLRQRFRQPLFVIMAVVAFVLLIACLNVAHLSMTRAANRRREFALRLALGASRWQVARQLLIENMVLALAGSVLGVLFARWASGLLIATMSTPVREISLDLSTDWHVIAFAVGLTLVTALICGSAPALRASRADVMSALKDDGRQTSGAASRFSSGLVATQIAVSLMLVVAAGLLVRTFGALAARPLGFDGDRVLIVKVDAISSHLSADARATLFHELVATASRLPGVERAAASAWTPLTGGGAMMGVAVPGAPPDTERGVVANFITPEWFATYGTPIVQGRDINDSDVASGPPVMVVNETFVRRFIRAGSPIGASIQLSSRDRASRTIIGVARDAVFRSGRMTPGPASLALRDEVPPMIYVPIAQSAGMRPPGLTSLDISLRSTGAAPAALAATVGAAFAGKDPNLSLMIRPLSNYVNTALAEDRIVAMLSGFFGFVGLVLAGLGVYGVTSYSVQIRRVELGIRLALGAHPSSILQFVLVRVGMLVSIGVVAGGVASLWLTRTLEALLYGLRPHDLTTFSGAVVILALVGGVAGWFPALRAARTDPASVLRSH
jgi:putative ABC transport system permease protein